MVDEEIPIPEESPIDPLDLEIMDLQNQITILDKQDQKTSLETQIYQRTHIPQPIPEWKHFKFIQRLLLKIKHADKWQTSDWVTLIIFIIGSITVLSQFAIGKVDVETAAALNIGLGVLSQLGSTLANKFSVSNTIPSSTYTYSVNSITPTETTSTVDTTSTNETLPVDEEGTC